MTITIASTPDALIAAARVLNHSVSRGDFDADPDFEDAASIAAGRFQGAAYDAREDTEASATVDVEHLDEILSVLESDPQAANGLLARFLADANAALDGS